MTLETIVSYAQIPPVCGNNAFQGVDKSKCIVRVALSKVDAYKAADTWGEFVNIQGDEALSIDGLHEESSKVDIYNLQGRLLYPKADIEEVKDALPKGVYLLRQGQRTIKVAF
ncbi:MAG: T9SS type A sorting domain-containing protein [Bacteroidales bacterium]|nr:T9SS type A sorting domain-containing protein [Bacteroidales bacterium]